MSIEANIQIVNAPDQCYFGLLGRVQPNGDGYDGDWVGFDTFLGDLVIATFSRGGAFNVLSAMRYSPGLGVHTYRADFMDNDIVLSVDGNSVLKATDNKFINSGNVGLANGDCQIQVGSFGIRPP
jgi:hypothetical protein